MIPISQLNSSDFQTFVSSINVLFEPAPPLSTILYSKRPFESYDDLISQSETIISTLSLDDKINVVNAHPRIGAPKNNLSILSLKEQGDSDPKTDNELQLMNEEYESKFGFKFVIFVNKRPKLEILNVIKQRIGNSQNEELECGLSEMILIARDRLKNLLLI